jgi:thiamine kinase-like enzyme
VEPALRAVVEAMPGWATADRLTVTPIEGGITNRNFRVDVDGRSFVVRLPGADTDELGIDREAERAAAEAAAAAGVGPEVVAYLPDPGILITAFVDGRPVPEASMAEPATLRIVVDALRSFHGGRQIPGRFSPFRIVERYRDTAAGRGVLIPEVYPWLHERATAIEEALGSFTARPCHNDLLNANFIRSGDRLIIVDYEYAGMGDAFFDLGNLSTNHDFDDGADVVLLEAYFGDVTSARLARLKLMRIMSDFREGMWGVVQQGLSSLDFDYATYATRHLERCRRGAKDSRVATWLEDVSSDSDR